MVAREDIERMMTTPVAEDVDLDFKQEIDISTDGGKKDFLAHVVAMGNTQGGVLLYGIEEQRDGDEKLAIPGRVAGVNLVESDETTRKIDDILRSGITPRLPDLRHYFVVWEEDVKVLVFEIPDSYLKPHMVWYKQSGKFWGRSTRGRYQMDIDQIRTAFLLGGTVSQRMHQFRAGRLEVIRRREVALHTPLLVLHALPWRSFASGKKLDVSGLSEPEQLPKLLPMGRGVNSFRHNIDGFVTESKSPNGYLQVYRDGFFEAATELHTNNYHDGCETRTMVYASAIEEPLLSGADTLLKTCVEWGLGLPVEVSAALMGVGDMLLGVGEARQRRAVFDRDLIVLPDVLVEDPSSADIGVLLKPMLDGLWQAAGYAMCFHFAPDGGYEGIVQRDSRKWEDLL